jgi:hypothetical protein
MPAKEPTPRLLHRCALGLWFCGIAAMGAIEFRRNAFVANEFSPTLVAWLWLAGAAACTAVGITLLLRELRRRR